jgi:hypothetical protein
MAQEIAIVAVLFLFSLSILLANADQDSTALYKLSDINSNISFHVFFFLFCMLFLTIIHAHTVVTPNAGQNFLWRVDKIDNT